MNERLKGSPKGFDHCKVDCMFMNCSLRSAALKRSIMWAVGIVLVLNSILVRGQGLGRVDLQVPGISDPAFLSYARLASFISLDGDHAYVGHGNAVHVFSKNQGGLNGWELTESIAPAPEVAEGFGAGVLARNGRLIVVGARRSLTIAGLPLCEGRRIYSIVDNGNSTWTQLSSLTLTSAVSPLDCEYSDDAIRIAMTSDRVIISEGTIRGFYVQFGEFARIGGYTILSRTSEQWSVDTTVWNSSRRISDYNSGIYANQVLVVDDTAQSVIGQSTVNDVVFFRDENYLTTDTMLLGLAMLPEELGKVVGFDASSSDGIAVVGLSVLNTTTFSRLRHVEIRGLEPPYELLAEIHPLEEADDPGFGKEVILRGSHLAIMQGGGDYPHIINYYERSEEDEWVLTQRLDDLGSENGLFMDMNERGELIVGHHLDGFVRVYYRLGDVTSISDWTNDVGGHWTLDNKHGRLFVVGDKLPLPEELLTLTSAGGQRVGQYALGDAVSVGIEVGHLAHGLYLLQVHGPRESQVLKFVK